MHEDDRSRRHFARGGALLAALVLGAAALTGGCDQVTTASYDFDNGYSCITYLLVEDPDSPTPSLPAPLVDLRGIEGQARLRDCSECANYPDLSAKFLSQVTQAFCGVASSTVVLNASDSGRAERPVTPPYKPYPFYTQCNLFNDSVQSRLPIKKVLHEGATLAEIRFLLEQQPTASDVSCRHATDATEGAPAESAVPDCGVTSTREEFVDQARLALATPGAHVIVNFSRAAILDPRKNGHGHFSPLAAYHEPSDSFLVMDVARYKYPPFWAASEDLWNGMRAIDTSSKRARGYVIVPPY